MNLIRLNVKTNNQKYPIIIGKNILNKIQKLFIENAINFEQCLVVVDKNVPKQLINKILKTFSKQKINIYVFNASEKNKNQKNVNKILEQEGQEFDNQD